MSEEMKLLPCPFCGGEARMLKKLWPPSDEVSYYVVCEHFGDSDEECPMGHSGLWDDEDIAIKVWNKRTPDAMRCRASHNISIYNCIMG